MIHQLTSDVALDGLKVFVSDAVPLASDFRSFECSSACLAYKRGLFGSARRLGWLAALAAWRAGAFAFALFDGIAVPGVCHLVAAALAGCCGGHQLTSGAWNLHQYENVCVSHGTSVVVARFGHGL